MPPIFQEGNKDINFLANSSMNCDGFGTEVILVKYYYGLWDPN
jgi:hypothetical protein